MRTGPQGASGSLLGSPFQHLLRQPENILAFCFLAIPAIEGGHQVGPQGHWTFADGNLGSVCAPGSSTSFQCSKILKPPGFSAHLKLKNKGRKSEQRALLLAGTPAHLQTVSPSCTTSYISEPSCCEGISRQNAPSSPAEREEPVFGLPASGGWSQVGTEEQVRRSGRLRRASAAADGSDPFPRF